MRRDALLLRRPHHSTRLRAIQSGRREGWNGTTSTTSTGSDSCSQRRRAVIREREVSGAINEASRQEVDSERRVVVRDGVQAG